MATVFSARRAGGTETEGIGSIGKQPRLTCCHCVKYNLSVLPDSLTFDLWFNRDIEEGKMLVTVSSKGQFVIPKPVRDALGLETGSQLSLEIDGNRIVLEPFREDDVINLLYGMFEGEDLLSDLEAEHRLEVERDARGL